MNCSRWLRKFLVNKMFHLRIDLGKTRKVFSKHSRSRILLKRQRRFRKQWIVFVQTKRLGRMPSINWSKRLPEWKRTRCRRPCAKVWCVFRRHPQIWPLKCNCLHKLISSKGITALFIWCLRLASIQVREVLGCSQEWFQRLNSLHTSVTSLSTPVRSILALPK